MPLPEELEHLSRYYADKVTAAPYAHCIGGHARFLDYEEITQKSCPLAYFMIEACAIVHAFRREIDGRCNIKIAIFESTSNRCFADIVSEEVFLIAISSGKLTYLLFQSSHILSVKQVRELLKLNDGNYKIDCDANPEDLFSIEYEVIIENLYHSLPFAMYSAIFTVFHELSHIINGHIDYKKSFYKYLSSNDKIITNKCLEMDADCFAVHRLQEHLLELDSSETNMDFHDRNFMRNFVTIIISMMFLDFDSTAIIQPESVKMGETHPPIFSRFNYCMACLWSAGDNTMILNSQSMYGVMHRLLRAQLEKNNITNLSSYGDKLIETINENIVHYRELEEKWGEVRPDLMKLRRRTSEIAQGTIFRSPPKLIEHRPQVQRSPIDPRPSTTLAEV